MTIYNINFRLNWRNSGIEFAQQYRAKLLRKINESIKFIYIDVIQHGNIYEIAEQMGFVENEIIYMHQYFSDIPLAPSSYSIEKLITTLPHPVIVEKKTKDYWMIKYGENESKLKCHLSKTHPGCVAMVDYWNKEKLYKRDYYSYIKTCSEYYIFKNCKLDCHLRCFFNNDGSTALTEYPMDEDSIYMIENTRLYGKSELFEYFLDELKLTEKDILLIDRSSKIAQSIIQNKGEAKLGVVIHAEHYKKSDVIDDNIIWNNHYEYVLTHTKYIDFFITATEKQRELLERHLTLDNRTCPKIYNIPVGSIEKIKRNVERRPYSIITASRLANEKHIDWLVEAVAKAKKEISKISFDIYGEGAHKKVIKEAIDRHKANDYIKLKGHQKLDDIYQQYELFVAGSTSEGFGLTLMEAVASGVAMIGLNVNYGNPTFIKNDKNGYLIPYDSNNINVEHITNLFAKAIVKYFNESHNEFHEASYRIAEQFTSELTLRKWEILIEEVLND